jgi:PAS domain-containing protein
MLELYSEQPIHDAEANEHILPSKYFTIIQRRRKLKNKQWLETILKSACDAAIAIDTHGRVVSVDPAAQASTW